MSRLQEPAPARDTSRAARTSRVVVTGEGPVLVEGPVEVVGPDGAVVRSDRGVVALCTCRRSRIPPFCDTSHRDKVRPAGADEHDARTTRDRS